MARTIAFYKPGEDWTFDPMTDEEVGAVKEAWALIKGRVDELVEAGVELEVAQRLAYDEVVG